MKAIVLHSPNNFSLEQVAEPQIPAGYVEIKVLMAGICGTDLHVLHGRNPFARYPLIPGHEMVGEVLLSPTEAGLAKGSLVTVFPAQSCGTCRACREGRLPHCPDFKFVGVTLSGGCFAERIAAHYSKVIPLPVGLDPRVGAMIEPLAVAVHANQRGGLTSGGQRVVVIGGGVIGLLVAQVARAYGAESVVISEPIRSRRELAQKFGFELVCDPTAEDLPAFSQRHVDQSDVVFDVVGSEKTLNDSEKILRADGRLVLVALPQRPGMGVPYEKIFQKELQVIGTRTYFLSDFPEAIRLLENGQVSVEPLISAVLPMARFGEGIELLMRQPEKYAKILIEPSRP